VHRFCVVCVLLGAGAARADDIGWQDVALFTGGVATALVAHEAGHGLANLALGNVPHLESVQFLGVVPFFAIAPDIECRAGSCFRRDGSAFGPGRPGLLLILLAGFDVQHATDEALLTLDPRLRESHAPFRTGLLAFNTLTSVAYAVANLAGIEPSAGDLAGAVRDARASRAVLSLSLLGIAGLDLGRWAVPDLAWLAWASRAAKVLFLGMPLTV
jgi:hypothetical protein